MGQKVNPIGLRLGVNRHLGQPLILRRGTTTPSCCTRDIKLRKALKQRLNAAGVSRIIIERPHKRCRVTIYAARPGVIIGKKGVDIEKLRKDVAAMTEGEVSLNIVEVRKPEVDAQTGGRVDRPAARASNRLPPRHEALDPERHAPGCEGHPHQRVGPPRRRRDRAHGVVSRRPRAAAHTCAPTSTTALRKPRRPTGSSA